MANFGNRIIRAAKLDVDLYEEVEADKSALGQAMGVVVLSSIAAGIGSVSGGKCTLHDLRRSAITNWASRLPIQVVQQLAGHSDISTTRKYYLTVRSEDIVSANKVVNSILTKASAN